MSNVHAEDARYQEPINRCDGCIGKAHVRLRVWGSWPTFLDLCGHHARRATQMYPDAELLIDNRSPLNSYVP